MMEKLYKKVLEKSGENERRTRDFDREERSPRDSVDLKAKRTPTAKSYDNKLAATRGTHSARSLNVNSSSTRSLLAEMLTKDFEDTRFKGKGLNCGRFSAKDRKDVLEKTDFFKRMKKNSKQQEAHLREKELLEKSLKEQDKSLPRFLCGKFKDPDPFGLGKNKKQRPKSADDAYKKSLTRLSFQEKKETLKPFVCGRTHVKEKIEYFSSAKTSRDPKELLNRTSSRASLLSALNESKPISDKPLKFGKYKAEKERDLYADHKVSKTKKNEPSLREIEEAIKKQEAKQKVLAPMKFGKKQEARPPTYFSPEKRKTMSEYFNELNRSARGSSASASLMQTIRRK